MGLYFGPTVRRGGGGQRALGFTESTNVTNLTHIKLWKAHITNLGQNCTPALLNPNPNQKNSSKITLV